jgi:hypothetical protein
VVKLLKVGMSPAWSTSVKMDYETQVRDLLREAGEGLLRIRTIVDDGGRPPAYLVTRVMGSVEMARAGFDVLHPDNEDEVTDPSINDAAVYRVPK